ncbi:nucI [Symbiodinium sp. CCMP2592]|nr:nucI [Symbiodinium sp. CCMP2592]
MAAEEGSSELQLTDEHTQLRFDGGDYLDLDAAALESYQPSLSAKLLSEFLGVFMLVLTVGLNLVNGSPATAWSAAAALMCMIYCLGNISGAHLNPAVTMAVVASGRKLCHHSEGVAYASTQLLAGTVAGFVYSMYHAAGPKKRDFIGLGPGPGSDYTLTQAGLVELSATLLLAYVVLSCATVPPAGGDTKTKNSFYFALAIGSCVTVGGFAIGAVSGGELNPAVALGITAASGMQHPADTVDHSFSNFVRLGIWEMTGAFVAAAFFKISHSKAMGTGESEQLLQRLRAVYRGNENRVGELSDAMMRGILQLTPWLVQVPPLRREGCWQQSEARRPRSVTEPARPEKVVGDDSCGTVGRRVAVAVAFGAMLARPRRAMAVAAATATEDEVVNVIDGDTVKLKQAGRCRLIGVNTPETVAPRQKEGAPPDCYGPEASALTKGLLPPGSKVRIEFDVEPRDKYGRQLVYVYRANDGLFINGELVKEGAARRLRIPPNVRYDDFFTKLETDARATRMGLWKSCPAGAVAPLIAKPLVDPKELKRTTCRDFSTYQEAKAWFDKYFPQYGDVAGLDGDKDGKPCEKLLRSKQLLSWKALPLNELRKECHDAGISHRSVGVALSDEEKRAELVDRLVLSRMFEEVTCYNPKGWLQVSWTGSLASSRARLGVRLASRGLWYHDAPGVGGEHQESLALEGVAAGRPARRMFAALSFLEGGPGRRLRSATAPRASGTIGHGDVRKSLGGSGAASEEAGQRRSCHIIEATLASAGGPGGGGAAARVRRTRTTCPHSRAEGLRSSAQA